MEACVLPAHVPGDSETELDVMDDQKVAARRSFFATALNDAVITAGAPFHMIELEIAADGGDVNLTSGGAGIRYFGDGVIVATASGSTAYNVSAGGPIISPNVDAFCVTPICPHSLSFRPVVISSNSTVLVTAIKVNEGTTLFCDGQASCRLMVNDARGHSPQSSIRCCWWRTPIAGNGRHAGAETQLGGESFVQSRQLMRWTDKIERGRNFGRRGKFCGGAGAADSAGGLNRFGVNPCGPFR